MKAQRLAISFRPPVFVIEYKSNVCKGNNNTQIRYRRIQLSNMYYDGTFVDSLTKKLLQVHADVLDGVNYEQIRRLCYEIVSEQGYSPIRIEDCSSSGLASNTKAETYQNKSIVTLSKPCTQLEKPEHKDAEVKIRAQTTEGSSLTADDNEFDMIDEHFNQNHVLTNAEDSVEIAINELCKMMIQSDSKEQISAKKSIRNHIHH